ncbi:hypothetical protein [Microbacterium sp.]|nr:hypothetical protein [Microbacterium sp.]
MLRIGLPIGCRSAGLGNDLTQGVGAFMREVTEAAFREGVSDDPTWQQGA